MLVCRRAKNDDKNIIEGILLMVSIGFSLPPLRIEKGSAYRYTPTFLSACMAFTFSFLMSLLECLVGTLVVRRGNKSRFLAEVKKVDRKVLDRL